MSKKKAIVIGVIVGIAILLFLVSYSKAVERCAFLDQCIRTFSERPIDKDTQKRIKYYEQDIEKEGLWGKILLKNVDLLDDVRQKNEQYVKSGVKCTYCHGSGRIKCDDCDGKGKKVVEWYSEGDWGDSSYTSYKCPTCGGSGRIDCPHC